MHTGHMNANESVRQTVLSLMAREGMNQTALAKASGVTYSHLSNVLRGDRQASVEVWDQLLAPFGMKVSITVIVA